MCKFKLTVLGAVLTAGITSKSQAANSVFTDHLSNNLGAWASLAIVLTAFLIATTINHRSHIVRAAGTLAASLACFSLVIWFLMMLQTGILENPKPNQTPMDSAKPALLFIQVTLAIIGGILLLLRAKKTLKNAQALQLTANNNNELSYGYISRVLHWTMAVLMLSLFPLGIFATIIPEQFWFRNHYYVLHKTIGLTVLALLVIRIIWNRRSKRPPLDANLKPSERKWAHRAHIGLYVLMLSIPITGYVMTSYHGYPAFFFFWELQPLWKESKAYIVWGLIHKYVLHYVLYLILGAHILGALKHHWVDKHDKALKRMVG